MPASPHEQPPPAQRPDPFRDPLLASAGLHRLAHKAHILVLTGTRFRAQGHRRMEEEVQIESTVTLN